MSLSLETPPNLDPPSGSERRQPENQADGDEKRAVQGQELLDRIKSRYVVGVGAFEENERNHTDDLNFVYNAETQGQWDPVVLQARQGKPCYTFNRVLGPVNMVVADMRQTRPAGKVRPEDELASEAVATILAGLCRNVENASGAAEIYKQQYKYSVAAGYGAWFLRPVYVSDDSFDQAPRIFFHPEPANRGMGSGMQRADRE